ncbi:MAG: ComF family protein [Anaerolineae bacterium]
MVLQSLLDLIFPPRCVVTGRPGSVLHPDVVVGFAAVGTCAQCDQEGRVLCQLCYGAEPAFEWVHSGFLYEGDLRAAIHALKYKNRRDAARPLASTLSKPSLPQEAVLVAVPLAAGRLADRGYNQAYLLAQELATRWALPLLPPEALARVRETDTQVGLDRQQRRANLHEAFTADAALVAGKPAVLVDDVCTTGATLDVCAHALRKEGASAVFAVTLERTP